MIAGGNRRFRWEFMRLPNETQEELCDPRAVWARMAKYGLNSSNCEVERSVVYRFRSLQ
jgi:3-(3-hydroxy-phenyl)propionate hydroxylase